MMRTLSATDILRIPEEDTPLLVLSDSLYSMFSAKIKSHTHGFYNHAMWMYGAQLLASQEFTLKSKHVSEFLMGHHRLKFYHNPDWSNSQKELIKAEITRQLKLPWWKRGYDWLGIIGQLTGQVWINFPSLDYCSENSGELLAMVEPEFDIKHPSPAQINKWCKSHGQMQVYGVFDPIQH